MYVTQAAAGAQDSPKKILFDAEKQTPKEMLDAYNARRAQYDGVPLDIEGSMLRMRPRQWSILSGYAGTGKTTYLRQLVCHMLKAGKSLFVATLEADPEDYIVELASTAAGVEVASEQQLSVFLQSYSKQLKVWAVVGVADHREILATIRALAKEQDGLDYAILDSFMMLDIDEDDIDAQRQFAALLTASAITTGVHIILVAHPKKPMDPDAPPTIHNVSGSSKLVNLAFNVLFVRRGPALPNASPDITQMELHILKQRIGGTIGVISGFYYRLQNQFHVDPHAQQPTFYLSEEQYPASGLTDDIPEHIMNPNAFKVQPGDTTPEWEF
jgi:archaellum biogenesis ATPase FlaH